MRVKETVDPGTSTVSTTCWVTVKVLLFEIIVGKLDRVVEKVGGVRMG